MLYPVFPLGGAAIENLSG